MAKNHSSTGKIFMLPWLLIKMELVNDQQAIVKASNMTGKQGFEGALLMKKAGLIGKGGEKLSLFKSGHKLLDDAIKPIHPMLNCVSSPDDPGTCT
jgi:hypothetical protein